MNIGIVTTWFERGAAYVSKQFMEVLSKKFEIYIYARGGESFAKGDPNWDLDNVFWGKRVESPFACTVIDKKDFTKWIKDNKIEVVLFNEQSWWLPILWCKSLGVKTVAYVDYYKKVTMPLFAAYDFLICNTKRHYSAFSWHKGAIYIPWGTNVSLFEPLQPNWPQLVKKNCVTFFHSAGMNPNRKGTDLVIKAFASVTENVELLLHTQVNLREFFAEDREILDILANDTRINIINKTVPAPGLYHLGDVYVYPSRLEGIGLTVAEAMSCGLSCIVTDCAPMNEFGSSDNSYYVEPDTYYARNDAYYWPVSEVESGALTASMQNCVNDLEKLPTRKQSAREHAVKYLNWASNSGELISFFEQINKIGTCSTCMEELALIEKKILSYENYGFRKLNGFYLKIYPLGKVLLKIFRKLTK